MAGKADIVDKIADLTGMPKTRVAMVYDHMFDLLGDALKAADARIACLCGADDAYDAHGVEAAKALKQAGAVGLFLAGKEPGNGAELRAAGVEWFIHRRSDMLKTLATALNLATGKAVDNGSDA
jgi:alanine racemase